MDAFGWVCVYILTLELILLAMPRRWTKRVLEILFPVLRSLLAIAALAAFATTVHARGAKTQPEYPYTVSIHRELVQITDSEKHSSTFCPTRTVELEKSGQTPGEPVQPSTTTTYRVKDLDSCTDTSTWTFSGQVQSRVHVWRTWGDLTSGAPEIPSYPVLDNKFEGDATARFITAKDSQQVIGMEILYPSGKHTKKETVLFGALIHDHKN